LRLRALSVERFGIGEHLAALERLKAKLAAEGLFAEERKRPLPRLPRRIGLVTGNDAAAKRDVLATITARFPAARVLVAETYVQGPLAAQAMVDALRELCAAPEVDVVVLARGGGSFEDLLPFSHERLNRAPALAVERKRARLEHAHGRLQALSPRATLERGYAIVRGDAGIVRSVAGVARGDALDVELADGRFGVHAD